MRLAIFLLLLIHRIVLTKYKSLINQIFERCIFPWKPTGKESQLKMIMTGIKYLKKLITEQNLLMVIKILVTSIYI